ncbi:hypothetical protein HS096_03585 [candidate division WWE3 bacterium]|uniref:Uncharacterized protein n=1 Tax=candidate division WWE3 bacterium TaxID=2053526 RepID=A0A928TW17_UNCKA|nr:hypothetical protein [candidate division WWE3 bacterium]
MPSSIASGKRVVREIRTKRGPLKAKFLALDAERVLVLVKRREDGPSFLSGTVFVRNRELKKRTDNRVEYMAYEYGLYEAYRAGCHIDHQSGQLPTVRDGELQEIYDDIRTARAYVRAMLSAGALTAEDAVAFKTTLQHLTRLLNAKRNPWKQGAETHFLRALRQKDKLGRMNIPAAAMAGGGGIGNLLKREDEVRSILRVVSARTVRVFRVIQHIKTVYEELRGLLGRRGLLRLIAAPHAGTGAMKRTIDILNEQARRFDAILETPFRMNARFTAEDLREASRIAFRIAAAERRPHGMKHKIASTGQERDGAAMRQELNGIYDRLQKGIAWIFAQYALELEIISPLSFLMESLRRSERYRRRSHGSGGRKWLVMTHALAPEAFDVMLRRMREYRDKVATMDDRTLRYPVQDTLLSKLDAAIAAAREDDWMLAKLCLKEASDQL